MPAYSHNWSSLVGEKLGGLHWDTAWVGLWDFGLLGTWYLDILNGKSLSVASKYLVVANMCSDVALYLLDDILMPSDIQLVSYNIDSKFQGLWKILDKLG